MNGQCRCGSHREGVQLGCVECGAACCPDCAIHLESTAYCSDCAAALLGTAGVHGGTFELQ
jgi:hypothetical protein